MVDLFTYLKESSDNSDFKAELSTRGDLLLLVIQVGVVVLNISK